MTGDAVACILLLLVLLSIPVMFVYGIYDCIKKGRIEEAERAQDKLIAEEKLKEQMEKPKFVITFLDDERKTHRSKDFNPYITSNRFLRNDNEYYSVVSSERVAGFALKEAYSKGYIRDDKGASYPTCNLHKIFIEEKIW